MKIVFITLVTILMGVWSHPSFAADSIVILKATVQIPMVKGHPAKGSITLQNNSSEDIILTQISLSHAQRVEIHESVMENEVSKMLKLENLSIKAGETLDMGERSLHFMVFGLDKNLSVGNVINGKFEFLKLENIYNEFKIVKLEMNSHKMY